MGFELHSSVSLQPTGNHILYYWKSFTLFLSVIQMFMCAQLRTQTRTQARKQGTDFHSEDHAAVGTLQLEKDGTLKCQARGLLIVCIIVAISSQKCSNIKPGSLQTQCRELLSVHQHTGAHSMKRICSWNVKVKLWSASKISKKKWHL